MIGDRDLMDTLTIGVALSSLIRVLNQDLLSIAGAKADDDPRFAHLRERWRRIMVRLLSSWRRLLSRIPVAFACTIQVVIPDGQECFAGVVWSALCC